MTPNQTATLTAICKRILWLRAEAHRRRTELALCFNSRSERTAELMELKHHATDGCRLNFKAIYGRRAAASESASHSRTLKQLPEAGLVRFVVRGDDVKPTCIDPTDAGWEAYKQLQDAAA